MSALLLPLPYKAAAPPAVLSFSGVPGSGIFAARRKRPFPMSNATFTVPTPKNEPVLTYAPGTTERTALQTELGTELIHVDTTDFSVYGDYDPDFNCSSISITKGFPRTVDGT